MLQIRDSYNRAESLVNLFVGLAIAVLGLRVIFRLFDANQTVGFVNWVYATSDTLLSPFRGLFPNATVGSPQYVLDFTALFAMAVYAAAGYLLISFLSAPARKK